MFTAIGRFIGLSLWFSNTVPLNFSRHVVKFLLERYWLLCLSFKYFGFRYAINFILKHSMGQFVVSVLFLELCLFILLHFTLCKSKIVFEVLPLYRLLRFCFVTLPHPLGLKLKLRVVSDKIPSSLQFSPFLRHLKVLSVNLVSCPMRTVNSPVISKYLLGAKHFHHTLGLCLLYGAKSTSVIIPCQIGRRQKHLPLPWSCSSHVTCLL